jgi:hypothetical protein
MPLWTAAAANKRADDAGNDDVADVAQGVVMKSSAELRKRLTPLIRKTQP